MITLSSLGTFYREALRSIVLLAGCGGGSTSSGTSDENVQDDTSDLNSEQVEATGSFVSKNGYSTSGEATLFFNSASGTYSLVLENFNTDNGPQLEVYFSQGSFATNFVNLGDLKSVSGTQRYDFSESEFGSEFDRILIWCDRFSVSFGEAVLN